MMHSDGQNLDDTGHIGSMSMSPNRQHESRTANGGAAWSLLMTGMDDKAVDQLSHLPLGSYKEPLNYPVPTHAHSHTCTHERTHTRKKRRHTSTEDN